MDRSFYYLLGIIAAVFFTVLGVFSYFRNHHVDAPVATARPAANRAPAASATPVPPPLFSNDQEILPAGGPAATSTPGDLAMPTPVPWTPPDYGKTVTVTYPGFTVVYSTSLGSPLAVQYAMVNGAKPRKWPQPIKVKTPDPRLIPAAGYARGEMALQASIGLYFGKAAGANTTLMTNVCAFHPSCLAGPWSQFAAMEKRWAGESGWIEVVAGPVLGSPAMQAGGVIIPVAFYRAYRRSYGDCLAFVIPQSATSPKLETYLTSISSIEAATGMSIFPNTVAPEQRDLTAKEVW